MGSQNQLCTMIGHFQGAQNFLPKVSAFIFVGTVNDLVLSGIFLLCLNLLLLNINITKLTEFSYFQLYKDLK